MMNQEHHTLRDVTTQETSALARSLNYSNYLILNVGLLIGDVML